MWKTINSINDSKRRKLWNCLHYFRTENKLKSHEKVCKNKDFYGIPMPSEKDYILKFNQYMKSNKMTYIIFTAIESLIKKIGEHFPCGYSMPPIWGIDYIENKHTVKKIA